MNIYKKGNFIEFLNEAEDKLTRYPSAGIKFEKDTQASTLYRVTYNDTPLLNIEFEDIEDENNNAYASQAVFDTWHTSNAGFNPATPASVTAVANDLSTHEANVSNPHSVTKTQVGLSNVDNTSDINKPISTAQQTALDLKAPKDSPTFTNILTKDITINTGYTVAEMVALSHVENKRIWNSELKDFFTSISGAWVGDRIVALTNNSGSTINKDEWVLPDSSNDLSVVLSLVAADGTKAIGWCAKTAATGNPIYIDGCRLFTTIASQATTRGQYIVNSATTAGRTFTSLTTGSRVQGVAMTAAAANGNTYIGAKTVAEIF